MTQTRAINAAADVICRAMQQDKSLPATLAYALDAAGMLQSPESTAELARLRAERQTTNDALAELTIALRSAEAERDALRARVGDGGTRTVDEDPITYALTDDGHTAVLAVTPNVAGLGGALARMRAAVEDPHDSPLHHDYAVPRDLPEVSS